MAEMIFSFCIQCMTSHLTVCVTRAGAGDGEAVQLEK